MAYPDGYHVNTQDPRKMGREQLTEYALAARDRVSKLEDMLRGVADKLRSEANGDGGLAARIDYLLRSAP